MLETLLMNPQDPSIDDLDRILSPDQNIAIWKRRASPAPASIQELLSSPFQELQFTYERSQPLESIGAYFDESLDLQSPDAFYLYFDFIHLAEKFLSLCKDKDIGIRLERVTHDNCKAFHVDFLSLRLLCTYHGPATEWLENSNVNRHELGKNRNDFVVKDHQQIKTFQTNWVGILKGENYVDNKGLGIVHRSPQITDLKNSERILLRMDALERFGSHK